MKVLTKKQKENRKNDIERAKEYQSRFPVVHVVENVDIPTETIQSIRNIINGKALFIKKSMFQKIFPSFSRGENYFLVFAKEDIREPLEAVEYPCFVKEGDISSERVVIPAGPVHNKKLALLLPGVAVQGTNYSMEQEYTVCEAGVIVTSEQSSMLQLLGRKTSKCHLKVLDVRDVL